MRNVAIHCYVVSTEFFFKETLSMIYQWAINRYTLNDNNNEIYNTQNAEIQNMSFFYGKIFYFMLKRHLLIDCEG